MATKGASTAAHRLAVPPGTDNFEFSLITNFQGYVSSIDPTKASPEILIRGSTNVYKTTSGTVAVRHGRLLYDATTDSTAAGIKSGMVWNTSLATTYPIRCANGKLQVESNVTGSRVWYDLLTGLTLTRFVFDSWWDNTDKKDKLLMVNGGTNVYDWSGGFGLFVSAINNTSITLTADPATIGFASTGTVTINGTDYTYTGIDSGNKKLTGVTGDASGQAANSVVMQKINTTANSSLTSGPSTTFTNDFCKVIGNQFYLGCYTSRLVYFSKSSNFKDFSQASPRVPGDGNVLTLDDTAKGIGVRQGNAHIFGGTSSLYIVTLNQITVSTTLTEQVVVDKIQLGNLISALAHEFIDVLYDNIIYLDQSNQVRTYGTFRNLLKDKATMLSQNVLDELNETDFTGGQLKVISDRRGDSIYITAPLSGYVYLYQERSNIDAVGNVIAERLWHPPMIWGVSRIDTIPNTSLPNNLAHIIGFSSANPQMYDLWDTNQWHDDSPTGDVAYSAVALFAYQNGGRRQGKIVFEKYYWEGYIANGTKLYGGIYYDYEGSNTILGLIINDPTQSPLTDLQQFIGVVPPSLGDASLGDNPLGDGLNTALDDQALLPKFRVINDVQPIDVYEFAPMIYSNDQDARWEVLAHGANVRLSQSEGVEIRK